MTCIWPCPTHPFSFNPPTCVLCARYQKIYINLVNSIQVEAEKEQKWMRAAECSSSAEINGDLSSFCRIGRYCVLQKQHKLSCSCLTLWRFVCGRRMEEGMQLAERASISFAFILYYTYIYIYIYHALTHTDNFNVFRKWKILRNLKTLFTTELLLQPLCKRSVTCTQNFHFSTYKTSNLLKITLVTNIDLLW